MTAPQGVAAWAEVDLTAIRSNTATLRNASGVDVMAVVKADAYGHGLIASARAAREGGATWLGTAFVSEALALRAAGDDGLLLAWLHPQGADLAGAVLATIDLSVSSVQLLGQVIDAAHAVDRVARVHLKADSGLSRGGASSSEWDDLVALAVRAQRSGAIDVVGLWSHVAYGDEPFHPAVDAQAVAFDRACSAAAAAGVGDVLRHFSSSGPALRRPDLAFDIVRPGLAVYGLSPGIHVGKSSDLGLRPAMTLRSTVAQVKAVDAGVGVSYSYRYTTARATRLALIPIGYADGIPRAATNQGPLLVGGQRTQVAGAVCMDQVVVDLGSQSSVTVGDEVVVFGNGLDGEPTAAEWAQASGTIVYEIVTRIGPRVARVYVEGAPR